MGGLTRDDHDPNVFQVDWSSVRAGRNPWKRGTAAAVDRFLVANAVKEAMKLCPHRTATGSPLVWNDYSVFMDLEGVASLQVGTIRGKPLQFDQMIAAIEGNSWDVSRKLFDYFHKAPIPERVPLDDVAAEKEPTDKISGRPSTKKDVKNEVEQMVHEGANAKATMDHCDISERYYYEVKRECRTLGHIA